VGRFEPVLVDFEEKIVGAGAIFDEKSGKIGQKFPSYSSTLSFAVVSTAQSKTVVAKLHQ
jgi:hypothetical protein